MAVDVERARRLEIYRSPSGAQDEWPQPARGTPLAFPESAFPIDAIFV